MDYDAVQDVRPGQGTCDALDQAGPSSSYRDVASVAREPISPPLTVPMNSKELPDLDTSVAGLHPAFDAQSRSEFSPYDHDDTSSIDWHSDGTLLDWASPTSTLLDHSDLAASTSSGKTGFFDIHTFGSTPFRDLESEPPPGSLADPLSLIHHDSGRPLWQQPNGFEDAMDLDPLPLTPPSPHSDAFCLPPPQPSSIQASGVCSSLENHGFFPSSPSRRYHSSLPDFDSPDLGFMTPVPHSPRGPYLTLPDLEMADERFPPSSPLSPQIDLPSFPGSEAFDQPVTTISPSLLGPPPPSEEEGLGLFVRPSAVEPPLARSPSPDQDDFRFLDVQLDPLSSNLDNDEFLQLRALRNRALDAERAARLREEYLAERVESASHALLPSVLEEDGVLDDPQEKRARKHDLHVAMDLRAEARKARKREKQRSKEIGLLLELKMCEGGFSMLGFGDGPGDAKHLVASMVMKRRDTSRPLANRKAASSVRSSSKTSLSRSVSHEDLSEALMDIE
ncbi:unnamed protein product [Somion occarium]